MFVSERDRAEDCSLEIEKELFRIGESRKKLVVLVILVGADIYIRLLLVVFC